MASAALAAALPGILSGASSAYNKLDDKQKTGILAGLQAMGMGVNAFISLPVAIIGAIVNFAIVTIILTFTLLSRNKERVARGGATRTMTFSNALLRAMGFALLSSIVIFIANLMTGGLATIAMVGVMILTVVIYVALSAMNPTFLHDVSPGKDGEEGYVSAYRKFQIAFWISLILGMVISIGSTLAMGAVGVQVLKTVGNIVAPIGEGMGKSPLSGILSSGISM